VDARVAGRLLAGARVVIGAGLIAAPRFAMTTWVGPRRARTAATALLGRAVGARDLTVGLGGLATSGDAQRGWLAAGVVCDTVDLVATLVEQDDLPDTAIPLILATAVPGIALGLYALAGSAGDPPTPS
jgi:hypothetical protein